MNLFERKEWTHRCGEGTGGRCGGDRGSRKEKVASPYGHHQASGGQLQEAALQPQEPGL